MHQISSRDESGLDHIWENIFFGWEYNSFKKSTLLILGEVKKTQDFSLNNAQSPVHRLVVPDHKNWKSKNIRTIKITKVKRKKLKLNVKSLKIEIESMNVKEYQTN